MPARILPHGYEPKHSLSIRLPIATLDWLLAKSDAEGKPVSTYVIQKLAEMAQQEKVQGEVQDGGLSMQAATRE